MKIEIEVNEGAYEGLKEIEKDLNGFSEGSVRHQAMKAYEKLNPKDGLFELFKKWYQSKGINTYADFEEAKELGLFTHALDEVIRDLIHKGFYPDGGSVGVVKKVRDKYLSTPEGER